MLDLASSGLRVAAPLLMGAVMDRYGGTSVFYAPVGLFIAAAAGLQLLGWQGFGNAPRTCRQNKPRKGTG